jgi:glycosyltransferase 2 family protein
MGAGRRSSRNLKLLAGVLLLSALLARSLYTNPEWRSFRWHAFGQDLLSVEPVWCGWALLSIYASYLVRALRWRVLMTWTKPRAGLWNLFRATVIGFAAIGVLGRAGEMVRPYLVARKERVPLSSQLAVWVLERCFDTLTVLVTVAFALRSFHGVGLESRSPFFAELLRVAGGIVGYSTAGLVVMLVVLRHFADPLAAALRRWLQGHSPHRISVSRLAQLEHAVESFAGGTRGLREWPTLAACVGYSIVEWVLVAFCYTAVFSSFSGGLRLGFTDTLVFMGAVMAGSMVNLPGIGGGIQVAAVLVLTEFFGLRPELAASVALLIWAFTFLVVIPPALILMVQEGLSWGKLRRLESEN